MQADDIARAMLPALGAADPPSARYLIDSILQLKPGARVGVPALLIALERVEPAEFPVLADALVGYGQEAVCGLLAALEHPDRLMRRWAAVALGRIGAGGPRVVLVLAEHFARAEEFVREALGYALASVGRESPEILAALVRRLRRGLKHPSMPRRVRALMDLGFLGPAARAATPDVLAALSDPDPEIRLLAAFAAREIDGPPAVVHRALLAARDDGHRLVRRAVIRSLQADERAA